MKNKIREANIYMIISKTFSGLNMNALKYLLPLWISPLTGVTLRCTFAALAFWIIGLFTQPETSTRQEKILLFLLGALGIYGFMFFYLLGLSKTTPVSSSIFSSLQPIWVFILSVIFFKETITKMKITGILIGLGGALLCILTQKNDDLASDAFTGNLLCLLSSMAYAIYLIASNRILKHVGVMTMLRYTFSGAAFSAIIVSGFTGFEATLFTFPIHWKPMAVLAFVLDFPDRYQLPVNTGRTKISENHTGCHLWLPDPDCGNHYLADIRTRSLQLVPINSCPPDLFERLFR